MKKIVLAALMLASLGFGSAHAATAGQPFDVTATLASQCITKHSTTPILAFGSLGSFGSGASNTLDITFKCTRNLAGPTGVSLSSTTGVVAGMAYTLSVGSATPTAGTDATTSAAATQDEYKYTVTGNVAAGQAGDVNAPLSQSRTLTITY